MISFAIQNPWGLFIAEAAIFARAENFLIMDPHALLGLAISKGSLYIDGYEMSEAISFDVGRRCCCNLFIQRCFV